MAVNLLSGANIEAISIITKGANRKRFFLRKEHSPEAEIIELPGSREIIKSADWERVYCVVAEPGALEDPGVLAGDQSVPDRWASEDEIRKAQASFMRNGGLINRMHESLEPYGQLVENALALTDFTVEGETIKKGSWYVAIEPSEEGKQKIEAGEFNGVSIQGSAMRTMVEKAEEFTKPGTANVSAGDRKKLGPLLAHYAAMAHPFTACKRDQVKHGLSEDHANRRCAVLKQLIRGGAAVAKWQIAKGMGSGEAPWSEDVAKALDRLELQSEMLTVGVEEFAPLFREEVAKARPFDEQKHPRLGGKFSSKGGAGGRAKAKGPGGDKQNRRNAAAANILGTMGYKGQKLGDAIRDFQQKHGLKVTGKADPQTMVALRSKMGGRRKRQKKKRARGKARPKGAARAGVKKASPDSPVWATVAR